jgi:hypothetical protein
MTCQHFSLVSSSACFESPSLLHLTHRSYQLNLLLDAAAAGSNLLSLPIAAECVVPEVVSNTALLDFGRCFVGHPYAQVCVCVCVCTCGCMCVVSIVLGN